MEPVQERISAPTGDAVARRPTTIANTLSADANASGGRNWVRELVFIDDR